MRSFLFLKSIGGVGGTGVVVSAVSVVVFRGFGVVAGGEGIGLGDLQGGTGAVDFVGEEYIEL